MVTAHEIVETLLEDAAAESGASGVTSSPANRTSSSQMQGDKAVPATESRMISHNKTGNYTELLRGERDQNKFGLAFSRLIEAEPDDIVNPKSYLSGIDRYLVRYLVFPTGNRPYGGGGWSRHAKYRPHPETVSVETNDVVFTPGKSVIVNGVRRLKLSVYDRSTGEWVRQDYPDLMYDPEREEKERQRAAEANKLLQQKAEVERHQKERAREDWEEKQRVRRILQNVYHRIAGQGEFSPEQFQKYEMPTAKSLIALGSRNQAFKFLAKKYGGYHPEMWDDAERAALTALRQR